MRTILCPVDFSETSITAMLYAYDIAVKSGAQLYLLHTYHIPKVVALRGQHQQTEQNTYLSYEREAGDKLDNLMNWLNKIHAPSSVNATYRVVSNFALDEIVKASYETEADLIVMETTFVSNLKDIFYGTHTVRVIEETHRPVLVVPASAQYTKISHILYTTQADKNQVAEAIYVSEFARFFEAKVAILPVQTSAMASKHQAQSMAEAHMPAGNFPEENNYIVDPAKSIQDTIEIFLKENPSALLAISAHRKQLLEEVTSGNCSQPLHTPVLVLQ
jgi:nucleotide-binding universal stress UspA family protein